MATNRSGRRTIPGYQSLDMEKDDKNAFNQDTTVDGLRNNNEYVEGVTLCWQNLQVLAVPETGCCAFLRRQSPPEPVQILKNVSGVARKGTLQVIMGGSGSGKTTLLNVLTRRNLGRLTVTGRVLVNGVDMQDDIASISAYVQQDDLFVGTMTVRQYLNFNAKLRMPHNAEKEQRNQRIAEVMRDMNLLDCADTVIGTPGLVKSLSGGEMKRLAFSAAMLTSPSLLFCDEPTSGLDSFMAQNVVQSLLDLVNTGRTVLCTIHQPSSQIYKMFDQLVFMSEGRVAFQGPSSEVTDFMSNIGYPCPLNFNPADYIIESLAVLPGKDEESRKVIKFICDKYKESVYSRTVDYYLESESHQTKIDCHGYHITQEKIMEEKRIQNSQYTCSWWAQISWCYWRNLLDLRRNKKQLRFFVLNQLLTAFFLGLVYFRQKYDSNGVMNMNGAMFLFCTQVSFGTAFTTAVAFSMKMAVFRRENQDRLYSASSFYLAQLMSDFPTIIIGNTCYSIIVYWMIGYNDNLWRCVVFVAALVLLAMVSAGFGHLVGAAMPAPQLTLLVLPSFLSLLLIFSGLLLKSSDLLFIFKPLEWISPFHYTYEALVIDQWQNIKHIDCSNTSTSCFPTGETVLKSLQIDEKNLPLDFVWNTALLLGSELMGMCALHLRSKKK